MEQLINYLKSFNILTDQDIEELITSVKPKKLKKGERLVTQGQICKEGAFIQSGIFRSFYYSKAGEEITYCFIFPNSLISAYSSYITQQKTVENIEAITDAEVLVFHRDKMLELEDKNIRWLKFFKIQAEQAYIDLEYRIFSLQKEKANKKYQQLLDEQPQFLQEIPLNYLASYLGITQRHLSRIRKEMMN
ncbi:Crp/Fnr family transcriptional regulator [Sediminitomix flava]|uniref:CRP-like cAMP-binding protein n=1 Tax=Sediminitomix flava TaxID=379075 RepID=A0A315ZHR3_SEDFL|nr:Crp/Fnr family transcriptional regulator [Sediminitomix flava]PWJ44749.1 CRP-like cAMP-binding protein [Sediminitomix flava]